MFNEYQDIMSVPEVSEALFIGRNRVYELLSEGDLKGFRIGNVWKIPKESVVEYVSRHAKIDLNCKKS